jgi:hypothetical protein
MPIHYLGQYHPELYLVIKVLEGSMGPQCYKNKNIYKYPYPTGIPEM